MIRRAIAAATNIGTDFLFDQRLFVARPLNPPFRSWSSRSRKVIEMASQAGELRVFLVAGEVSGDSIAARLMASLKKLSPFPVRFAGVGGLGLDVQGRFAISFSHGRYFSDGNLGIGATSKYDQGELMVNIKLKKTVEAAILFQPHVVVTVDSKGFSFRLLKQLKGRYAKEDDSPVHVHYVAPSFWAWKGGETRLKSLSESIDHMLCILPFEEKICKLNGLSATYVGHPLLEDALYLNPVYPLSNKWMFQGKGDDFRHKHGLSSGATVITLLPGSRLQEVTRMLPIFLQTVEALKDSFPELSIVVPVAPNHHVETYIEKEMQSRSSSVILMSGASINQKYDAFTASTAAICTSGSAVMELQLAALPCVVAYRAHFLTEWLIKLRTNLKFISLPNILLDSAVIPEALFQACTSENLATILRKIILDDDARKQQIDAARKVFELLWRPSPEEFEGVSMTSRDCCFPSMIAASTILHATKHQKH